MKRMFVVLLLVLAGCASSSRRAPEIEQDQANRSFRPDRSSEIYSRPSVYVVQRGDTLRAIAFNYGIDPRDLAERNHIQDPNLIQVGQQINLIATESRPVVKQRSVQYPVKNQPKVMKYAYSERAEVKEDEVQRQQDAALIPGKFESKSVAPVYRQDAQPAAAVDDDLAWTLPTQGNLTGSFSVEDHRKGVEISGKLGQPILAAASGKVVYSGNGLRGYGNLLIIKHNNTFISAYAHNGKLLVKEGGMVKGGQEIATMGNTDSEGGKAKLYFEIRRLREPVDPARYMSFNRL